MPIQRVAVRCTFRSRGYSEEEIESLRNDLSEVAALQPRRHGYPEAGDMFEMTVVIQFVGTAILGGVIWDGIKVVGRSFLNFYKRKRAENEEFHPEIDVFELRFDDIDVRFRGSDFEHGGESNYLSERAFEFLPELVACVKEHLESEPLKSADKLVVDVFEPEISTDASGSPVFRFVHTWRVAGVDITGPRSYSASDRTLGDEYIPLE